VRGDQRKRGYGKRGGDGETCEGKRERLRTREEKGKERGERGKRKTRREEGRWYKEGKEGRKGEME